MTRPTPPFELRWAQNAADVQQALRVRVNVFCHEQGVPLSEERDALDDRAVHLLAVGERRVVGTLRLLTAAGVAKVGRVAVERDWRGRGVASSMLRTALATAREQGCREARLASQTAATGLYSRAGFVVASEEFREAGIPHVWMRMALVPPRRGGPFRPE